jgi:hypothetical protein
LSDNEKAFDCLNSKEEVNVLETVNVVDGEGVTGGGEIDDGEDDCDDAIASDATDDQTRLDTKSLGDIEKLDNLANVSELAD